MVEQVIRELPSNIPGAAIYVWYRGGLRYSVVHWMPGMRLSRAGARLQALRLILDDTKATRVQVVYSENDFEETVRSERGIFRLCTEAEKRTSSHSSPETEDLGKRLGGHEVALVCAGTL